MNMKKSYIYKKYIELTMVQRFGVSIDKELLNKFDLYIKKRGYSSRSKAMADLIRDALIEDKIKEENIEVFGTITVIYNHEVGDTSKKITHLQHRYLNEIRAAVHVHVDMKNCLEVIIVHGKSHMIQKMVQELGSLKGVKNVKYQLTLVEP